MNGRGDEHEDVHETVSADPRVIDGHPPVWGNRLLKRFGRWYLDRSGWTVVNPYPSFARSVMIVAPHSTNWDFIVGISTSWVIDLKPTFVAKHTLFRWPLGPVMRWLGGIPINRSKSIGFVEKTAAMVDEIGRIALVITPEGTRKNVDRWRTGFYHIARAADLPIIPAYIDWGERRVGFGDPFWPTGNLEADIELLRDFYSGFRGLKQ